MWRKLYRRRIHTKGGGEISRVIRKDDFGRMMIKYNNTWYEVDFVMGHYYAFGLVLEEGK